MHEMWINLQLQLYFVIKENVLCLAQRLGVFDNDLNRGGSQLKERLRTSSLLFLLFLDAGIVGL